MEPEPKDETLITRIGLGEEDALVCLMERHKEPVFRFVYRYLNNEADSAEVTEETFFKVYQNAGSFTARAKVTTWIFTIALNLSRDRLRRRKKQRGQISLDAPYGSEHSQGVLTDKIDSHTPAPSRLLRSSEDLHLIQGLIANLPDKLKFPFVFCILEEHSYDACADVLKTTRKTVETRIYRARKRLRAQCSELFKKD